MGPIGVDAERFAGIGDTDRQPAAAAVQEACDEADDRQLELAMDAAAAIFPVNRRIELQTLSLALVDQRHEIPLEQMGEVLDLPTVAPGSRGRERRAEPEDLAKAAKRTVIACMSGAKTANRLRTRSSRPAPARHSPRHARASR